MSVSEIVYATTNPGKIFEVRNHLEPKGFTVLSPLDLGVIAEVEESGQTLEENSLLKAQAFQNVLSEYLILSDDTGLEIDALNREPGVFVRRWKDHVHEMTDEEIIAYALERMAHVPQQNRGAQFRTVITLLWPNGDVRQVDGILRGEIQTEAAPFHIPGLPFEGLFFVPEWGRLLGETRHMSHDQKVEFLSHRERAVDAALLLLREYSAGESKRSA